MFVAGLAGIGLALLWNTDFPINKNLWSSSFVLLCAGCSLVLLSIFYLVVDVWRHGAGEPPATDPGGSMDPGSGSDWITNGSDVFGLLFTRYYQSGLSDRDKNS